MHKDVLEHFPCPGEYKTPLEFVGLQDLLQTHTNYEHQLLPRWTMRYRNEKNMPLEGRFMEGYSFAQETKSMYKTLTAVPCVVLAKSFLKCLDTENIKEPLHPRASDEEKTRSVFYGDRHRPRK